MNDYHEHPHGSTISTHIHYWIVKLFSTLGNQSVATFKCYSEESHEKVLRQIKDTWGNKYVIMEYEGDE